MKFGSLSLIVVQGRWQTNAATQFLVVRAKSLMHLPALMSLTDMILIVGRRRSLMKVSFLWSLLATRKRVG